MPGDYVHNTYIKNWQSVNGHIIDSTSIMLWLLLKTFPTDEYEIDLELKWVCYEELIAVKLHCIDLIIMQIGWNIFQIGLFLEAQNQGSV
jgi:hypothetical protein